MLETQSKQRSTYHEREQREHAGTDGNWMALHVARGDVARFALTRIDRAAIEQRADIAGQCIGRGVTRRRLFGAGHVDNRTQVDGQIACVC